MGVEIERKFLVRPDGGWVPAGEGTAIRQGYVAGEGMSVRVRIAGNAAFLTLKSRRSGAVRSEFEYPIPLEDALDLLQHHCTGGRVEKIRYQLDRTPGDWIVDVFMGANEGLILAEVELPSEDTPFTLPDWVDREVTADPGFYNESLAASPWSRRREALR